MKDTSKVRKIAFLGDHLPRKCGIATFTSDLLGAVAEAHPESQCFCVSVNDIKEGYEYPEVVRFEIDEQDLSSYLRAADFLGVGEKLVSSALQIGRGALLELLLQPLDLVLQILDPRR